MGTPLCRRRRREEETPMPGRRPALTHLCLCAHSYPRGTVLCLFYALIQTTYLQYPAFTYYYLYCIWRREEIQGEETCCVPVQGRVPHYTTTAGEGEEERGGGPSSALLPSPVVLPFPIVQLQPPPLFPQPPAPSPPHYLHTHPITVAGLRQPHLPQGW